MIFQNASFELAAGRPDQLPESTLPEIVFSGRSNVGKSTLINKILNRKALARVSASPGKTETINFYRLDACRFADLPGYGYARAPRSEKLRWAQLAEHYLNSGRDIRLVVQMVDMRHPPTGDDLQMIDFLSRSGFSFLIAATKSDKLNRAQREQSLARLRELSDRNMELLPVSAVTSEGVEEIRSRIVRACVQDTDG